MELTESDALLLATWYSVGEDQRLTVIGRSQIPGTNLVNCSNHSAVEVILRQHRCPSAGVTQQH